MSNYPRNMLVEKVFETKGGEIHPVGVFVAVNDNDMVKTGWSRCRLPPVTIPDVFLKLMRDDAVLRYNAAVKNSDSFDMKRGVSTACDRLDDAKASNPPAGRNFLKKYRDFQGRCVRYFQDATYMRLNPVRKNATAIPPKTVCGSNLQRKLQTLDEIIKESSTIKIPPRHDILPDGIFPE